ncbi:MAG: sugar kinase [Geminicoccaceae bacterium]
MKKIVVVGEILAEIMADSTGAGFMEPITLTGPFPSGAPAIFVDQAAKLGQPSAIISTVGNDDFGRINLDRLKTDGVDVSAVRIDDDRPTGTAFVRYRENGSRDFVFNIRHSACGLLSLNDAMQAMLAEADHFHVMGSSLSSPEFVALNVDTALAVKKRGGTISFDPNLRKEMLDAPGMRAAMMKILTVTDLFLPSDSELTLLTKADSDAEAVQELLDLGIAAIVHKLGVKGVHFYNGNDDIFVPAFTVEEVDPTGAGDSFGGTFTTFWLRGTDIVEALTLATAAGALAVTKRGPMEGTSDLETLDHFVSTQRKTS